MDDSSTTAPGMLPDTTPLSRALSAHEVGHNRLAEMLAVLEHRLSPVLRPQESADKATVTGDAQKSQQRSEVVSLMEDFNYRLERHADRLKVLLERIEI